MIPRRLAVLDPAALLPADAGVAAAVERESDDGPPPPNYDVSTSLILS